MTRPRYKLRPDSARETGVAEFGSFFHIVDASEGDRCAYPARLDTYGCGCAHDCSYCYAKSLLDFRGLWNPRAPLAADMAKVRALIPSLRGTPSRHAGDLGTPVTAADARAIALQWRRPSATDEG